MKKSLFGYGLTTKAIAKNAINNEKWDIYDDKFEEISQDEFGNFLLPPSKFDAQKSTLEIPSPGFPRDHELVKKAQNLISEYDFFAKFAPIMVWISGTNGKTTTTQMAQFLLQSRGSVMGGNVGTPLANLDKNARFWMLETSSFTMHYTKFVYPKIYALLPISPDHLSWHGGLGEYEAAKLKPLSMMCKDCIAIIPAKYAKTASKAQILTYESDKDLAQICGVNIDDVDFKVPFLMDALMALCIEKLLIGSANLELLNKFKVEKNRLEEFSDTLGRTWVNDTKATNLDATIQALKRYKKQKIHLIIGGDDKGVDLHELFENFCGLNLEIYAIGSNTDKLINLSKEYGIKAYRCEFLNVAVKNISSNLHSYEIALLSPACASLDQFSSYAERGDKFKEFVSNLS